MKDKNTWLAKIKRTFTAFLPVDKNRRGQCIRCGRCCRLPNDCPFLKIKEDGNAVCLIYLIRPLNCRKYPRTKDEWLTSDVCGFRFD
jgi:Fe-S-cluster containining protein